MGEGLKRMDKKNSKFKYLYLTYGLLCLGAIGAWVYLLLWAIVQAFKIIING